MKVKSKKKFFGGYTVKIGNTSALNKNTRKAVKFKTKEDADAHASYLRKKKKRTGYY